MHSLKVKIGKTRQDKQRYKCSSCGKTFTERYTKHDFRSRTNEKIIALLKDGCGIRSIARLLLISPTTVLERIRKIAANVHKPAVAFGRGAEGLQQQPHAKERRIAC